MTRANGSNVRIHQLLKQGLKNNLRNFSVSQNWNLTDKQISRHYKKDGLLNIYATFEMLEYYIKNSNGAYEKLKDYVTRDEMKIFFIISLIESLQKISDSKERKSHPAVKNFFKKYITKTDQRRILNSFSIVKVQNHNPATFDDWVEVLYGIRNAFAHEIHYIHQVFTTSKCKTYQYKNCAAITDKKGVPWLKNFETQNFSFEDFLQLISRAVREWLLKS